MSLDKSSKLSVVMSVRDKSQFVRATETVLRQSVKGGYELVVVDYGSEKQDVLKELKSLRSRFGCIRSVRLLKISNIKPFHRGKAMNVGFRWSTGQWLFTTDADVMFPPGYFEALLGMVTKSKQVLRTVGKESVNNKYRDWGGCGLMLVSMKLVYRVRGYDESFDGYGEEDIDFRNRLQRCGCKIKDVRVPFWTHLTHSNQERGQAQTCCRLDGVPNTNWKRRNANDMKKLSVVNDPDWGSVEKYTEWQHYELK